MSRGPPQTRVLVSLEPHRPWLRCAPRKGALAAPRQEVTSVTPRPTPPFAPLPPGAGRPGCSARGRPSRPWRAVQCGLADSPAPSVASRAPLHAHVSGTGPLGSCLKQHKCHLGRLSPACSRHRVLLAPVLGNVSCELRKGAFPPRAISCSYWIKYKSFQAEFCTDQNKGHK